MEAQTAERLQISRQHVLEGLQTGIAMAREQGDVHAMIAGWREIAKMCGYYAPERKVIAISASANRVVAQLEALSDAELLQLAEKVA